LVPDSIRPSSARQFACSAASGASASTPTCCGATTIDAAYCARTACAAVVGCTPSANT
jgi:hypothetical protein